MIWWAFLSQESEEDGPELIKTQAADSEKDRQACDHLEKKYFWSLRKGVQIILVSTFWFQSQL